MEIASKQFKGYATGAEFFKDTAMGYGIDEAIIICGNYLDLNLKRGHAEAEKDFCRELFAAMYEITVNKEPVKILYPYSLEKARERGEERYYTLNRSLNMECGLAVTEAINLSCYDRNFYNLENAAWKVILQYGFNRVSAVLARHIQAHKHDGRYSCANKQWAQDFILTPDAFSGAYITAHAILVDGVAEYVRNLYFDMGAERHALQGNEEAGEFVEGYEIKRAVMTDNRRGYVIAHNPDAVGSYVCWQFILRSDKRHYNWGVYGFRQAAVDSFNARVFINAADAENI